MRRKPESFHRIRMKMIKGSLKHKIALYGQKKEVKMFRNLKVMEGVLQIVQKQAASETDFIRKVTIALDEVLSLNDYNTVIERLKEDIEDDPE